MENALLFGDQYFDVFITCMDGYVMEFDHVRWENISRIDKWYLNADGYKSLRVSITHHV